MIVNGVEHQEGCCCHLCEEERMGHLPKMRSNARAAAVVVKAAIVASRKFKRRYREAILRESRDAYITKITWKEWKRRKERRERMRELLKQNVVRRLIKMMDGTGEDKISIWIGDGR